MWTTWQKPPRPLTGTPMGGHLTCLAAAATGWNEQQVETGLGSAYNLIDMERCFTTEMSPKCVDSVDSVRVVSVRYQMVALAIFIWMKAVAKCDVKLEKPTSPCTCNSVGARARV